MIDVIMLNSHDLMIMCVKFGHYHSFIMYCWSNHTVNYLTQAFVSQGISISFFICISHFIKQFHCDVQIMKNLFFCECFNFFYINFFIRISLIFSKNQWCLVSFYCMESLFFLLFFLFFFKIFLSVNPRPISYSIDSTDSS